MAPSSTIGLTHSAPTSSHDTLNNDSYQVADPLSDDEYASLKADIEANGVDVPVVIDEDGSVIDGHHRIKACRDLGIDDYPTDVHSGLSDLEKRSFARKLNTQRRQLDDSQKRDLIERALLDYDDHSEHRTDKEIATECGSSDTWVRKARHDLVQDGKISTDSDFATQEAKRIVVRQAIKEDPDASNREIADQTGVSHPTVGLERDAMEAEKVDIDDIDVFHDDFRDVEIEPESVDHIVTDPPYAEEHLPLWSDLSELAAEVLKPGGFVIAYVGKSNTPEVLSRLGEQLDHYWMLSVTQEGSDQFIHTRKIRSNYRPVVVFQKQPFTELDDISSDVVEGSGPEKEYHDWQQSVDDFAELIDRLTDKGDRILDPMVGTGTTLLACERTNREAVGIEEDGDMIDIINERLEDVA